MMRGAGFGQQLARAGRACVATPERKLLLAALSVRLVPAALVYGLGDVQNWYVVGEALATGANVYATKYAVVWPPLWIVLTGLAYIVSESLPLPFHLAVKSFPIAADVITAFVIHAHVRRSGGDAYRVAMLWALNPVSIYVSAIHGQFDPIPALCVAAAVVAALEGRQASTRGLWAGIGAAFKTWPLFVVPALVSRKEPFRSAVVTASFAIGLFAAALAIPALFVGAGPVMETFAYRGYAGWWGVTSIARLLNLEISDAVAQRAWEAAMIAVALLVYARSVRADRAALFLLLTFCVLTPGFGLQYLVWLLPVAILCDRPNAVAYTVIATATIAFEALLRPHAGYLWDMFRTVPHQGYALAIGGENDLRWTRIDRLPLWLFCVYWWGRTAWRAIRE